MINIKNMLTLVVLMLLALPAAAASNKPGKGPHAAEGGGSSVDVVVGAAFTVTERNLITQYFQDHRVQSQRLPPGIAKNLARGKPLPPGIAKRFLPGELNTALPVRSGYERVIVGSDILLIDLTTRVVVDILRGVLR